MTTAFDTLNAALHGAQSGKSILGLQNIVSSSSGATIGGIDSSAETWWDNTRVDYSTNYSTTSFKAKHTTYTDYYNGILAMRDLWNDVSEGNDTPKLILTSYEVGSSYEAIFEGTGYTRLTPRDANDFDGSGTAYRSARVLMDRDCAYTAAAGVMYFLQPKYLKFKIQAGKNFAKTPYKEPANQLAKVAYVVFGGQLVTNHRKRQGILHTITV
jgi:hypothetical protein